MQKYLIKNIQVVNEGRIKHADVLIKNGRIEKIGPLITQIDSNVIEINGEGKYLLPGAIDDQVHFREPGLTHKATIYTEAKAAVAGVLPVLWKCPIPFPMHLHRNYWKINIRLLHKLPWPIILFSWAPAMTMQMKF